MINFQKDNRTFQEKLAIGNKKEEDLVNILNLCGVPAKLNNEKTVTDIDIQLTQDNMLIDCKLLETPFYKSKEYTGIDPANCLTIKIKHVRTYQQKEKETGKKCWIAFFINFKDFDVYKLVFIPNSYLVYLMDNNLISTNKDKINFDSSSCRDMNDFLNYIKKSRIIQKQREKNN